MKLTQTFRDMVIKAIKDDGSLGIDEQDWWTSFTDHKGRLYDVNVYGDEYADIPPDEFRVAVYDVSEIDGEYVTDYENDLVVFEVMRDALVDVKDQQLYQVRFWHTTYGKCEVVASCEGEAKEIIDKQLEAFGLDRLVYDVTDRTCGVPLATPYYKD